MSQRVQSFVLMKEDTLVSTLNAGLFPLDVEIEWDSSFCSHWTKIRDPSQCTLKECLGKFRAWSNHVHIKTKKRPNEIKRDIELYVFWIVWVRTVTYNMMCRQISLFYKRVLSSDPVVNRPVRCNNPAHPTTMKQCSPKQRDILLQTSPGYKNTESFLL